MSRFIPIIIALVLFGFGCAQTTTLPKVVEEARETRPAVDTSASPEAPPTSAPSNTAPPVATITFTKYSGMWFDIQYPSLFTARPGRAYCIPEAGCDSAYFSSPDGAIEFYVFSPQWGGDPMVDLAVNPVTERQVDEKTAVDSSDAVFGPRTTRWVTIAAKDGSYTRSYVDIVDENGGSPVRHAFGIRYKDQATYNEWRDSYLKFKASLVQYSD